jgi:hypothetical protein
MLGDKLQTYTLNDPVVKLGGGGGEEARNPTVTW